MKSHTAITLCAGLTLSSAACADEWGISYPQALMILLPPLLTLLILFILSWRYAAKGERLAVGFGSFSLWLLALSVIPSLVKIPLLQYAVSRWPFETYIAYFAALIFVAYRVAKWRGS